MHADSKRYFGEDNEERRTLYTVFEDNNEDVNPTCEQRIGVVSDKCDLEVHRETPQRQQSDDDHNIVRNNYGKECEERYFATMGDDKIIQFICKICNKSSTSQKSIKQHVSWKHGSEDSEGFYPTT